MRIKRVLRQEYLEMENISLKQPLNGKSGLESLTAESPAMRDVLAAVRQVAITDEAVLLLGEPGTGKNLMARTIHQLSPLAAQPFVTVRCSGMAPALLESELFGCERGALPGATKNRISRIEQAHGGTLFLDEIAEMDASVQVKLLRFLDEKTFERAGSNESLSADVRLITATSKDLESEVKAGKFREDLHNRLREVEIALPPLCQRREDIPLLAESFLREFASAKNKPVGDFTPECLEILMDYSWPGNVRQLRAILEHAVGLSSGDRVSSLDLPDTLRAAAAAVTPSPARVLAEPDPLVSDEEEPAVVRSLPRKTLNDRVQGFMWSLEGGMFARILKLSGVLIGFILLALWFNLHGNHNFSNREAMESAQLGRHLAAWKGYTTYSIRPLTLGLLQRADPQRAAEVLQRPVPDLSIAPGYPFVLACLMKVLPFNFAADRRHLWSYKPELMIVAFNEVLFFAAVLLLFQVARRLFDSGVAWVSAIIFAGSEIYWKFSLSGLSTIWLLLIFLSVVWCLVVLEEREHLEIPPAPGLSLALAAAAGALVGIGGLSRYSFAWLMVPVLLFMRIFFKRNWGKMGLLAAALFSIVMAPWITRNLILSHTPFGTAGYALMENTRPFEEDRVERAFDPSAAGLGLLSPRDVANKFLANEGKVLRDELPRLGSNWVWSFFLCGLLLPFRDRSLRRLSSFLVCALALMAVAQALGQTHLSVESPEINSENLLVLLSPLVLIFGTGFFFTILHQMAPPHSKLQSLGAGLFAVIMCAPLLLDLASPPDRDAFSPYAPTRIQGTASMMQPEELMMSDIPWAVAWYGDRSCAWLTLDDGATFEQMNKMKPVHAIYLTERTSDRPFLSQTLDNKRSWGRFLLQSLPKSESPQGAVPPGFPLTKAPAYFAPAQMFISDAVRWKIEPKR
jgi:transcriptional regulator with AAA-type ATPase domain